MPGQEGGEKIPGKIVVKADIVACCLSPWDGFPYTEYVGSMARISSFNHVVPARCVGRLFFTAPDLTTPASLLIVCVRAHD